MSNNHSVSNLKQKLAISIVSLIISLLIIEIGLRYYTIFPIHSSLANRVSDDILLYKMNPLSIHLNDVDKNGFRNPNVPKSVDIVALGDSHTYGYNVSSENSWPQQLATMTDKSVYNFGIGGYGSIHYHHLLDEAIKLKPKNIILGLYLANDLYDTCNMIRELDYWEQWAIVQGYNTRLCFNSSESPIKNVVWFLIKKTAIGSLIAYSMISNSENEKDVIVNEKLNNVIIKNLEYHNRNIDLKQPDIFLSFEITRDILKEANEKAKLNAINFSVMFIPSKSRVFFDYLIKHGYQLPDEYYKLIDNENKLIDKYSLLFEEAGIQFVDAKPYVEKRLYQSGDVYPYSDNHPLEIGYKAYAEAVYEHIFVK